MRTFLFFVAAQMAGNGIACLVAAVAWHWTRPRIVASRLRDLASYTAALELGGVGSYASEVKPC